MARHRGAIDDRPPWLVITLAALVVVVIVSIVALVLAGYRTGEIVTGIGEIGAAIAAGVFAIRLAIVRATGGGGAADDDPQNATQDAPESP